MNKQQIMVELLDKNVSIEVISALQTLLLNDVESFDYVAFSEKERDDIEEEVSQIRQKMSSCLKKYSDIVSKKVEETKEKISDEELDTLSRQSLYEMYKILSELTDSERKSYFIMLCMQDINYITENEKRRYRLEQLLKMNNF